MSDGRNMLDPVGEAEQRDYAGLSLLAFVLVVLRQRQLIVTTMGVLFGAVVALTLVQQRTYTAIGTFIPHSGGMSQGGVASLASQLGLSLSGVTGGDSPDFYAELLRSQAVVGEVVGSQFDVVMMKGLPLFRDSVRASGSLMDVLGMENPTSARTRYEAMRRLSDMTSIAAGRLSGIVTVSVSSVSPTLSQQLAARMLSLVDDFNRTRRQTRAGEERRFIDERLAAAEGELRVAEDALEKFLQDNRSFANSPDLQFRHDRLQREVVSRQQVYTLLAQAYEQARIDEVRNTPVITVLQAPVVPALPDRRRLLLKGLVAMIVGALLGVLAGFLREVLWSERERDQETFAEYRVLAKETIADLRRPWRLAGFGGPPRAGGPSG